MSDLDYMLSIKYTSNLDDVLKANHSLITAHEKFLKSTPLRLAYDLDDKELTKKFADMEARLKQFLTNAQATSSNAGGLLGGTLTQTEREAQKIKGLLESTEKIMGEGNKKITRLTQKFQGEDGSIITRVSQTAAGSNQLKPKSTATTSRDRERSLTGDLRSGRFEDIQKRIDTAAGAGDTAGQLQFLRERNKLLQELKGKYADIASSPAYKKVEGGIQRTNARIDNLTGRTGASLDRQREKSIEQNRRDAIADRQANLIKELSSGRFAQISQGINQAQGAGDTTKEVTLLRERLGLLKDLQSQYQDIESSSAFRKVEGAADRTNARIDNLTGRTGASLDRQREKSIEQNRKAFFDDQNRNARQQGDLAEKSYKVVRDSLVADRARVRNANELAAIEKRIADLDARRVLSLERSAAAYRELASNARLAGNTREAQRTNTLADNFERQAASLRTSLGGKQNQAFVKAEQRALEEQLRLAKQHLATEEQISKNKIKQAKAIADLSQRNAAVTDAINRQKQALDAFAAKAREVSANANLRGFNALGTSASNAAFGAGLKRDGLVPDLKNADAIKKTTDATDKLGQKSKSASKGILGIANTFFQWNIAARAVTAALNTIGTAIDGVIAVDRQFAVLRSIFRGTAQEAQKLKVDVLELAAANGRSAEEALQAATGFARLGLNRVQINKLVETSLIAANVAEITSADAAEKLTALMQQYKLSVDEVAAALGRLNSISNTQNVTVGQLLSNISLTASVARQAGIALEDLEGIIGVTIANTRATSSEIGNAIKFVIQRLRKPENLDALKLEFDIDLTKANGDLREGTEIIAELARLYPLLTKAEQSRLLDLAAGTRQASRFATVLETFNVAQNVTANAVGDTNSALRENESITQSLASRLQGLETAWISFGVALGDSGLLDQVAEKVSDLGDRIRESKALLDGDRGEQEFKVGNNKDRAALDLLADNLTTDPTFFDRTSFAKQELETFQKLLPLIDAYTSKLTEAQSSKDLSDAFRVITDFQAAAKKQGVSIPTFQQAANLLDTGGGDLGRAQLFIENALKDSQKKQQESSITLARGRVEEFERGLANAQRQAANLRQQVQEGAVDPKRVKADFNSFRNVLDSADNGAAIFASSLVAVNTALESGDYGKAVAEIEKVGEAFQKELPARRGVLSGIQSSQSAELQRQIAESNAARKELEKNPQQNAQGILDTIAKTTELQDRLAEVNKTASQVEIDPLSAARQAKLTQFFDALRTRTDEIARAFNEIDAGENTNTADLKFGRASAENFLRVNAVQESLNATIKQAEKNIAAIPAGAADRNDQVSLQQEIISAAKTRLSEEIKIAEEQDRQNRLLVEANRIRDAARSARNNFSVLDAAGGAGQNQSEKLADQLRNAQGIFQKEDSINNLFPPTNTQQLAASSTTILAAQEASQSRLISLRQREQQIQLEMRQASFDMVKAERERTEQASKRLALASREEQLTAAALAASIRAGGPLTQDQFLGLSQRTRQVADGFNNANPFASDDSPRGQYTKAVTELSDELATARNAIAAYTRVIADNQRLIKEQFSVGGRYAPRAIGDPAQAAQAALLEQNRTGGVVLNANGMVMNINLAQGFAALQDVMTVLMENRINKEFEAIKQLVRNVSNRNRLPDMTPAMNAE